MDHVVPGCYRGTRDAGRPRAFALWSTHETIRLSIQEAGSSSAISSTTVLNVRTASRCARGVRRELSRREQLLFTSIHASSPRGLCQIGFMVGKLAFCT